ncbi:protein FAR1-RELATED SEQUENCE 5-like [Syzygium oleosum]|uniref:protein FAR1-RELATED SEQUENCE 5-like n=1 Tax=Syzygium oleosum TaxID=219896 RepID=UPI0024BB8EFF|nr:protein FAR1-RELATED SEQUENCE 5-like [Syzygium oleosum]
MSKAGIPPRQILSSLRQSNPNVQAIAKTVYNMKAKFCREYLNGRTMIQALMDELSIGGFIYNFKHDAEGHLTHLFFSHPISMALTKSFSSVFVMDCTYKTNRYKMPLLDIIGVSCFNTSFYSCFVFLRKEEEEDYVWALTMFSNILGVDCQPSAIVTDRELALMNAVRIVFPKSANLLCVWHIEKNIVAKCKPQFEEGTHWDSFMSDWSKVLNSKTEAEYDENIRQFEYSCMEKPSVVNYIKNTWLPFKELFVTAWTDLHMHFGNRVTSRAEGAHSTLKAYLQVSTGDLVEVKKKICLAVENQFQEIKSKLSSEKVRVPHHLHIPLFRNLITRVSVFTLDKLYKQTEIAKSRVELPPCTGHFVQSMGLPCAHEIRFRFSDGLPLDIINLRWRLDTRSFLDGDITQNYEEDSFKQLLHELERKYQEWPLSKKEIVRKQIEHFIRASDTILYEPQITSHKGRPSSSKTKGEATSTKRDPSAFEIIEKRKRCGTCKCYGHNSRTCKSKGEDLGSNTQSRTIGIHGDEI